jgi:hypothetical protein
MWWFIPIIPATKKAKEEAGGWQFEASLDKVRKTLSQNQNINKWQRAYLAYPKPWVQSPELPKKM